MRLFAILIASLLCAGTCLFVWIVGEKLIDHLTSNPNETSYNYAIGDSLKEGTDGDGTDYYYGGIVDDSVVINIVDNQTLSNVRTYPLYIELGVKSPVRLPKSDTMIQIEAVDRTKGTVKIHYSK